MPERVGDFEYDCVGHFREDLAPVRKDGQEFHIHPDGSPAYEARFDFVEAFSEGLALVEKDGEWFHIRPDGTRAD